MKKRFIVSAVIATFNSQRTIHACLQSIRSQNFDQEALEIIICDGSSQDKTLDIAKKFNVSIISIDKRIQNAEYNKSVGIQKARGRYLLFVDHDNVLPHNNWIINMLEPLRKESDIIASETLRYHYDKSYSLLDRYFALFGAGDPLAYYLKKADRLSYLPDAKISFGSIVERSNYYKVTISKDSIPTLGANGFLIKKDILFKFSQTDPHKFFHIDINVDLINTEHNNYAFTKDTIIHFTGYNNIAHFLFRRKLFMEQYYYGTKKNRRYSVYTKKDFTKLLIFIIMSVTFIIPTWHSIKGWIKIRDTAWFLHPFLCVSLVFIYGYVVIMHTINSYAKKYFSR